MRLVPAAIRFSFALLVPLFAPFLQPASVEAREWYAEAPALVADLESGRVLHQAHATDPWFPASLTKLMTAYVALDAVRSGRARMDSLLTVSAQAAAQPPSKMGFKAGSQLRLDTALVIIMVKSANDVAAAIAENIGGSSENFAAMMNEQARRIGMRDSVFTNPHGLPDARKRTTARDMALLARALWLEFPQARFLFGMDAIQYRNQVMRNHNGLIGRYPGADGMKTGYICSSGFNVVVTAERGGRRLVAVVLGAPTAAERTAKSASLLEYGFASGGSLFSPTLTGLPNSDRIAPVDLRPLMCSRRAPSGESDNDTAAITASFGDQPGSAFGYAAGAGTVLPLVDLPDRRIATPVRVHLGNTPPGQIEAAAPPAPVRATPVQAAPTPVAAPQPASAAAGAPLQIAPALRPATGPVPAERAAPLLRIPLPPARPRSPS